MSNETKPERNFWQRLGRAFVNLLRLTLILAVVAGLAAAAYYGAPYLYNKYIQPVNSNTARLTDLEEKESADISLLTEQVNDLKSRLSTLESRQTESAQAMAELQGQIAALETAVETHSETLQQLEAMQASLTALETQSAAHENLLVGNNSALVDLQRQVALSRAIELLSRSRLYLSQSNFGLAKQDVQVARALLASLQDTIPAEKSAALEDVITRLDLALGNLPAYPVIAVGDVDIAWQILVDGLPEPVATETLTPEIAATETPTPTPDALP